MNVSSRVLAVLSLVFGFTVEGAFAFDEAFNAGACSGAPMSYGRALDFFEPGMLDAKIGKMKIVARMRTCNPITGCTAFVPIIPPIADMGINEDTQANASKYYESVDGDAYLDAKNGLRFKFRSVEYVTRGMRWLEVAGCDLLNPAGNCAPYVSSRYPHDTNLAYLLRDGYRTATGSIDYPALNSAPFSDWNVTDHCAQGIFSLDVKNRTGINLRNEYEFAYLIRY